MGRGKSQSPADGRGDPPDVLPWGVFFRAFSPFATVRALNQHHTKFLGIFV